jgi:hypothetical protein
MVRSVGHVFIEKGYYGSLVPILLYINTTATEPVLCGFEAFRGEHIRPEAFENK